jgi:hypothetical protein
VATKEEVLALVATVGMSEAARRTGTPKTTVHRWARAAGVRPGTERNRERRSVPIPKPEARREEADGQPTGAARTPPPMRARATPPPPEELTAPDPAEVVLHPGLTTDQSITIHLLLAGHREEVIAKALRITVHRIRSWRKDPAFLAAYDAGLADLQSRARKDWLPKGLDVLDAMHVLATSAWVDPKVRVAAGVAYLDRVGFPKTERVEMADEPKAGLSELPTEALHERIRETRARLQMVRGGKS